MYGGSMVCDPVGTGAHMVLRVPALGAIAAVCGCAWMLMGSPSEPCEGNVVQFERNGQVQHACVIPNPKLCGKGLGDAGGTPTVSCG